MAALGASIDVTCVPGTMMETEIKSSGTLTFFRGSLISIALGTGKAQLSPADADEFYGVSLEKKATVVNDLVRCAIRGIFLFQNTNFSDANLNKLFHQATTGTDNPADLQLTGGANASAGAAGRLIAVKTTGTNGWLDISDRSTVLNT